VSSVSIDCQFLKRRVSKPHVKCNTLGERQTDIRKTDIRKTDRQVKSPIFLRKERGRDTGIVWKCRLQHSPPKSLLRGLMTYYCYATLRHTNDTMPQKSPAARSSKVTSYQLTSAFLSAQYTHTLRALAQITHRPDMDCAVHPKKRLADLQKKCRKRGGGLPQN
jgi:hypothetical protein